MDYICNRLDYICNVARSVYFGALTNYEQLFFRKICHNPVITPQYQLVAIPLLNFRKRYLTTAIIAALLFGHSICTFSQNISVDFYTSADGLSNSRVWHVTQDEAGLMWIGTNGLNRFDGKHFTNFLNSSDPAFLLPYDLGVLFRLGNEIGYIYQEAFYFVNTQTGATRTIEIPSSITEGWKVKEDVIIRKDKTILFWLTEPNNYYLKLCRLRGEQFEEITELNDLEYSKADPRINILSGKEESIYYPQKNGPEIVQLNLETGKKIIIPAQRGKDYKMINGKTSVLLLYDGQQFFYLNDKDEQFHPHPVNAPFQQINHFDVNFFEETQEGHLWITTTDRQLYFWDNQQQQLHDFSSIVQEKIPVRTALQNIFIDQHHVAWIVTQVGLLKVSYSPPLFPSYINDTRSICGGKCSFRGFIEDKDANIYASFYPNIFKLNPLNMKEELLLKEFTISPYKLEYQDEKIILNTGKLYDLKTGELLSFHELPFETDAGFFARQNKHQLWWLFLGELYFIDFQQSPLQWIRHPKPSLKHIHQILYDEFRSTIWIAGQGLEKYQLDKGIIEPVSLGEAHKNVMIRGIFQDQTYGLWLGTERKGLLYYDPQKEQVTRRYSTKDGLCNNFIVGILPEGDSCLWLSTNNGLSRFSIKDETFINFYESDGLPNNEFNRASSYAAKDGRLFFGGISGFTGFYPEQILKKLQANSGEILLKSYTFVDTQKDSLITQNFPLQQKRIEFKHHHKFYNFHLAFTDYNEASNIEYSYRIKGFATNWSEPETIDAIRLNSLPVGNYTLQVKARTQRGQWTKAYLEIPIKVFPPWWASKWAYLVYASLFFALLYIVFRFQTNRIRIRHQLNLEQQEAKRLKELDNFKSQFFTNITHEFRTPLTVILGMTDQIKESPKKYLDNGVSLIEQNGKNMLQLVNQMLDLSKMESNTLKVNWVQDDILRLIKYVTESFQSYADRQTVGISFSAPINVCVIDHDPEKVQQIMTNLISNAIKFTPKGGDVACGSAANQ